MVKSKSNIGQNIDKFDVTPNNTQNKEFDVLIQSYLKAISLHTIEINKHIASSSKVKSITALKALIHISTNRNLNYTKLRALIKYRDCQKVIDRLMELQLIDKVLIPVYMPLFDKNKMIKCYNINKDGIKVLKSIFMP